MERMKTYVSLRMLLYSLTVLLLEFNVKNK